MKNLKVKIKADSISWPIEYVGRDICLIPHTVILPDGRQWQLTEQYLADAELVTTTSFGDGLLGVLGTTPKKVTIDF